MLQCFHLHHENWFVNSFPFFFPIPWTWLFMSNSAGVCRKAEDAYSTLPLFSGVRIVHCLLLQWMYYFGYFMFFVLCVCLFSMSGLCPWITFFWFPLEFWFPDYFFKVLKNDCHPFFICSCHLLCLCIIEAFVVSIGEYIIMESQ